MNNEEFNLDIFENADDETKKKIAAHCPASDKEKERMFAMSRKIYNERSKDNNYDGNIEVSGVEQYKKPIWQRFTSIASALLLITAIGVGGGLMLKNRASSPMADLSSEDSTTSETSTTTEAEPAPSPFGDLNGYKIKIAKTNPSVEFEPDEGICEKMISIFNNGEWTQLPNDTSQDPALADAIHITLTKDDSTILLLLLYNDNTIISDYGTTQDKWEVNKEIPEIIYTAIPESMKESFLNTEASSDNDTIEMPDVENMYKDLAVETLNVRGIKVEVYNIEVNTIKPGYVIYSDPKVGEMIPKGTSVKLYVSTEGKESVTVDNYIGMTVEDASELASYYSLRVNTQSVDSSEKEGTVIDQEPKVKEEIEPGSTITLYVSNGNPSTE